MRSDVEMGRAPAGIPVVMGQPVGAPAGMSAQTMADRQMAMELQREQMLTLDKLELSIRHGFIRKVMGLLVLEVCIALAVVCLFVYTPGIVNYVKANHWTLFASIVALFVTLCCSTSCCLGAARVYPHSLFVCAGVAVMAGVFLGVLSIALGLDQDNTAQIWIAFGTTTAVMGLLGVFAMQTRYDFSGIGPYLSISCLLIFMFAFLGAFMSYVGGLLWIGLVVTLMSMYVVYDVQLVVGGKHRRYQFTVDDAPLASLALFTDFIMIFAVLLALGEGSR